jgi:hypothetical protein
VGGGQLFLPRTLRAPEVKRPFPRPSRWWQTVRPVSEPFRWWFLGASSDLRSPPDLCHVPGATRRLCHSILSVGAILRLKSGELSLEPLALMGRHRWIGGRGAQRETRRELDLPGHLPDDDPAVLERLARYIAPCSRPCLVLGRGPIPASSDASTSEKAWRIFIPVLGLAYATFGLPWLWKGAY